MSGRLWRAWPLWSVLTAQAVLTVPRLLRSGLSAAEAAGLQAGHAEWAHWLHSAALPGHPGRLAGATVLYPPLAAAADSVGRLAGPAGGLAGPAGGLAAARCLSLLLALGTTVLVYSLGWRLFGRRAAFFAAALFAVCGLVVHYGSVASADALAMFFLTLGAWAGARAADRGYRWVWVCAAALAVANAAQYATTAWDVVVVCIAVLHGGRGGVPEALRRGLSLTVCLVVLDVGLLAVGGPQYAHLAASAVSPVLRLPTLGPVPGALWQALVMTGALVLPAAAGAVIAAARRGPAAATCLVALLAAGSLIAPAGAMLHRVALHQPASPREGLAYGLAFAALAAGFAVSAATDWAGARRRGGTVVACVAAIALVLAVLLAGRTQEAMLRGPSAVVTALVVSAVRDDYRQGSYILTDGTAGPERYYLPGIPARAWLGIFRPTAARRVLLRNRICAGLVSTVVLKLDRRSYLHPYDYRIAALLSRSPGYRLSAVARSGRYVTKLWRRTSPMGRSPANEAFCTGRAGTAGGGDNRGGRRVPDGAPAVDGASRRATRGPRHRARPGRGGRHPQRAAAS